MERAGLSLALHKFNHCSPFMMGRKMSICQSNMECNAEMEDVGVVRIIQSLIKLIHKKGYP